MPLKRSGSLASAPGASRWRSTCAPPGDLVLPPIGLDYVSASPYRAPVYRIDRDNIYMTPLRLGVLTFACITGALALGASSAHAQISPFNRTGPKMQQSDLAAMDKAANPLFEGETFTPGAKASWSNPATGWAGTVTAKGTATVKGLPCRVLDYHFDIPNRPDTRLYTAKWCRAKDGTWKLG
eukprot:gene12382-12469_t